MTKLRLFLKNIYRWQYLVYAFLLILNLVFFSTTAPLESSAAIVILGFLIASLNIIALSWLVIRFLSAVWPALRQRQRKMTVATSSFLIVVLALASLGQLTWRDGIVVFVVWLLGYVYSMRFRLGTKPRP